MSDSHASCHPRPDDVVIVGAKRTPQGRLLGSLASQTSVDLGAAAVSSALKDSGVSNGDVGYVVMGQVLLAGAGQNPARQVAVKSGIPLDVQAEIVNKVCLSGLDAIIHATRMIRVGDASIVVAGGMESMTNAPHIAAGVRQGKTYGDLRLVDAINRDGLHDAVSGKTMGEETDRGNQDRGITREEQDHIAALSHQRAEKARDEGLFDDEIVPIEIPQRKGDPVVVRADEGIRPGTTEEGLSRLRPAFLEGGTITAASSSQISDGAAAVVLTTREEAEKRGLRVLAVVGQYGQTAGPDTTQLHSQPSSALKSALDRSGWSIDDLDVIEINEAFAAVVAQSIKDLGVDMDRVNVNGGGIALGHPVGASGARLVVHMAHELERRGGGRAGVSLCGGGGQGDALTLWA